MQDRDLLAAVGRALFGDNWKLPLAHALHVNTRAVQKWHRDNRVPDYAWPELAGLVESRHNEINQLTVVLAGRVRQN